MKESVLSKLTLRQKQYLNFTGKYMRENGFSPSIQDYSDNFKTCVNSSVGILKALEAKGAIKSRAGVPRSIVILSDDCPYCKCK